nr:hypothetical protein BaRGS_024704 [Batillaria attramentaria]
MFTSHSDFNASATTAGKNTEIIVGTVVGVTVFLLLLLLLLVGIINRRRRAAPPDKDSLETRSNSQSKPPSIIIPRINTQNYRGFAPDTRLGSSYDPAYYNALEQADVDASFLSYDNPGFSRYEGNEINCLDFSNDGNTYAISGKSLDVYIYQTKTNKDDYILAGSWCANHALQVFDYGEGTLVREIDFPSTNGAFLYCAQYCDNNVVLAGGSGTNSACVLEVLPGETQPKPGVNLVIKSSGNLFHTHIDIM